MSNRMEIASALEDLSGMEGIVGSRGGHEFNEFIRRNAFFVVPNVVGGNQVHV